MQLIGESATQEFGTSVAKLCKPPLIIYLIGDLGSGKTTFARGFIRTFGHQGTVKSPTFTLVETYSFEEVSLYHYDLYRLQDPHELEYLGIRDISAEADIICLIEWPERGGALIPQADLKFTLKHSGDYRDVEYRAESPLGQSIIDKL